MKLVLHEILKYPRLLQELDPTLVAKLDQATQQLNEAVSKLQELIPIMNTATLSGIENVRKEIITTPITITKGDVTDLRGDITLLKRGYALANLRTDDSIKLAKSACTGYSRVLSAVRKLNNTFCTELVYMAKKQVRS